MKNVFTKTDKRILREKLEKYWRLNDASIDRIAAYPPNRIPSRTRDMLIRKLTRTNKAVNVILNELNNPES